MIIRTFGLALVAMYMYAENMEIKVADVCDLFRDPVRWNGVMIQVRSPIERGAAEDGPWLTGGHCDAGIVVKGEKFPNLIYIQDPRNRKLCLHPVEFKRDQPSADAFSAILQSVDPTKEYVWATVIGLFETRSPLGELIQQKRPWRYNGFGHLGGAPAQIIVKTMTDMRITPKKR
jgi:hypothetical protein